jgi:PIN domain nuclease of toxin-antitoxin system
MITPGSAILVDTHYIIWQRTKPGSLTAAERDILDNAVIRQVSIVSIWEIAMLQGLGRVPVDPRLLEVPSGFDLLPVRLPHCQAYAGLALHHRDPFDRMLVAQARSENLTLVTRDRPMQAYRQSVTILP